MVSILCPSDFPSRSLCYDMAKYIEDDEMVIEDLPFLASKGRKINSKKKGNRVELELTKILTAHFGKPFSRSVGSGNRWGQVSNLPSHAKTTLLGDLCAPEGFKWVIESKGGYEKDIDFRNIVAGNDCPQLDAFIQQSSHDHETSGRLPIIMWKQARRPWITFVREKDLPGVVFSSRLHYKEWVGIPLKELLDVTATTYWFEE
jgi:hypothetical protein